MPDALAEAVEPDDPALEQGRDVEPCAIFDERLDPTADLTGEQAQVIRDNCPRSAGQVDARRAEGTLALEPLAFRRVANGVLQCTRRYKCSIPG